LTNKTAMGSKEELKKVIQKYIKEMISSVEKEKINELPIGTQVAIMVASKYNALPLYLGWGGDIAIRPDCSFIYWDDENQVCRYDVSLEWQIRSLSRGTEKYPELKVLLPSRSDFAKDCQLCGGKGKIFLIKYPEFCGQCLGLGWLDDFILSIKQSNKY